MQWMPWLATALSFCGALVAAAHALIYKRDPRSATMWVLVIWLLPLAGPVLFGINRFERRARRLRSADDGDRPDPGASCPAPAVPPESHCGLSHLVDRVTGLPLTSGNRVHPLHGGAQAYPEMLAAIARARRSVVLAVYIFDRAGIGRDFIEALDHAQRRGVQVRVLIDDVYVRLARTSAYGELKRRGVPVASFNPPIVPARLHAVNLRNHRKILVVDGALGFTGGMNIHAPYWRPDASEKERRDLHFMIEGPAVAHLAQAFARDWFDTVNESLDMLFGYGMPAPLPGATALARGIEAGPDETHDRIRWTFMGALSEARRSVRIRTPYFLPDQGILTGLSAAALRGVEVDVLIPEQGDHLLVQWASRAHYWQVLEHGARIFERSGPFDHSKLMIVDRDWICFGSANWDARSLRLNFEFNVEVFDSVLAAGLEDEFLAACATSRLVSSAEVNARSLPAKLRDGAARLFTPVL